MQRHKEMPNRKTVYRGAKLGLWISVQRHAYNQPRRGALTAERIAALEAIEGWAWQLRDIDQGWQQHYDLLLKYVAENRQVPKRTTKYEGVPLGTWVQTQRAAYHGKLSSHMTSERIHALERVEGWYWKLDRDARWWEMYGRLEAYMDVHGSRPPVQYAEDGVKLGSWAQDQRSRYLTAEKQQAAPERFAALSRLRGWRWQGRAVAGDSHN